MLLQTNVRFFFALAAHAATGLGPVLRRGEGEGGRGKGETFHRRAAHMNAAEAAVSHARVKPVDWKEKPNIPSPGGVSQRAVFEAHVHAAHDWCECGALVEA